MRHPTRFAPLALLLVAGCAGRDPFDLSAGGVQVTRSLCPAVAVPSYTGDVTLFDPPASRDATAIDVVATLTDVRSTCNEAGAGPISTSATFNVVARRRDAGAARDVTLPYFATVMRAGTRIVSKQVGQVTLHFAAGQPRATAAGSTSATIDRAGAMLPSDVQDRIMRRRRAKDKDASVDPMTDPKVRAALREASFELLVGLQLTPEQLSYNATR